MKVKNWWRILVVLLLFQQTFAQTLYSTKQFTLKGKLHSVHMDSVLLYYENMYGKYVFQSRPIFNDAFILLDTINEPTIARILFKNLHEVIPDEDFENRSKEIYLEPGLLTLTGDPSKLTNLKLSGSDSNDELDTLNSLVAPIRAEMKPLIDEYNKEKDPEKAAIIHTRFEPYDDRIKAISYRWFLDHPNSYVTVNQMVYYVTQVSLDSVRRIYKNFNAELKQSTKAKIVAEEIKKMESALPGKIAADFTATDLNGKTISLADYKGKYVLLDFWASWCPPCRKGNPHMVELYKQYHTKGLNIVGIADDDATQEAWKKAITQDGVGLWPNALSGADGPDNINDKYAIHFVPTRILIDPEGKIIGRFGDNNSSDVLMDRMLSSIFDKIPDK